MLAWFNRAVTIELLDTLREHNRFGLRVARVQHLVREGHHFSQACGESLWHVDGDDGVRAFQKVIEYVFRNFAFHLYLALLRADYFLDIQSCAVFFLSDIILHHVQSHEVIETIRLMVMAFGSVRDQNGLLMQIILHKLPQRHRK